MTVRREPCPACNGTGRVHSHFTTGQIYTPSTTPCFDCDGRGIVRVDADWWPRPDVSRVTPPVERKAA
jgi:hypothetical protein